MNKQFAKATSIQYTDRALMIQVYNAIEKEIQRIKKELESFV